MTSLLPSSPSSLTRPQFEQACKALIDKYTHSTSLSSDASQFKGWSWVEHPTVPGLGYLSRIVTVQGHARDGNGDLLEDDVPETGAAVEDPALAPGASSGLFICVQSIAFSPTFQVPVFYFTAHDTHGSPLMLEEIMNTSLLRRHALPETQVTPFALVQPDVLFPLLSQGDHPTLGTPAWFIHPCGTGLAMGELIGAKNAEGRLEGVDDKWLNWLETWFVMLGNIVEL